MFIGYRLLTRGLPRVWVVAIRVRALVNPTFVSLTMQNYGTKKGA